ncbi:MAG TPA: zinc ribbon domain-containing protein [Anaerolineae bacterium]|nr:zinc ribbon domain-containing protein [Anaerolineae bacterium]
MAEKTEQRLYHGKVTPGEVARVLTLHFNAGETYAQTMRGDGGSAIVQVRSRNVEPGDPNTAVTVHIVPTKTGVTVAVTEQQWLGVAADLAKTGVMGWLNPRRLLGELDDIARNVRWLGLRSEIWKAVEAYCQSRGSGRGAAPLLSSIVCPYCGTPNDLGVHTCQACRAPLAEAQPVICPRCGTLNDPTASLCVNCGADLRA